MRIYYKDILVGDLINNRSITIDEALELIGFDEKEFKQAHGFDDIDYNEFRAEVDRNDV